MSKEENLYPLIEKASCYCLNEDAKYSHSNALNDGADVMKTDCDEQFILQVGFNQTVKLSSIQFSVPLDETCPKHIHIFINNSNLGFDGASDSVPGFKFELVPDQEVQTMKLPIVRFQRVDSVTLFGVDNQGDVDTTVVHCIKFLGSPVIGTDVSKISKGSEG